MKIPWIQPCPIHIKKLKAHRKDILRVHTMVYTGYLLMGVVEHFGLNVYCLTYGSLSGLTVLIQLVCEEL